MEVMSGLSALKKQQSTAAECVNENMCSVGSIFENPVQFHIVGQGFGSHMSWVFAWRLDFGRMLFVA